MVIFNWYNRSIALLLILVGLSITAFTQSDQSIGNNGLGSGAVQDLDTAELAANELWLSMEGVDSLHKMNIGALDTKRTDEDIQDMMDAFLSIGLNGILNKTYDDVGDELIVSALARTLTLSNDSLSILGGNKIDLSGLAGTQLWTESGGNVWRNSKVGVKIDPTYDLDILGDGKFTGVLGLGGFNPNPANAITASGHARFYSGANYVELNSNGTTNLVNGAVGYQVSNVAGTVTFKTSGQTRMTLNTGGNYQINNDLTVLSNLGAGVVADANFPLKARSTTDDQTSTAAYFESNSATKLLDLRGDGAMEGEFIEKWAWPLNYGVVSRDYSYPGFVADPYTTNILYDAVDRFDVTVTNTHNANYDRWFDGGLCVGCCNILANDTSQVNIEMANKGGMGPTGVSYPDGIVYVYTYTGNNFSGAEGRFKESNGTWHAMTYLGEIFGPSNAWKGGTAGHIYAFSISGFNFITELELTLENANPSALIVRAIEYHPQRNTGLQMPFYSKYFDQYSSKGITFENANNEAQVVIDPGAAYDLTVHGGLSIRGQVTDENGVVPNSKQLLWGSSVNAGQVENDYWHRGNTYVKLSNSTAAIDWNPSSGAVDITDLDTKAIEKGQESWTITSSDTEIPVSGTYEFKGAFPLDHPGTATAVFLKVQLFVNGVATGVPHYVASNKASIVTVNFYDVLNLTAGDDVDLRSTRISGTDSVTLTAANEATFCIELKSRS